LPQLADDVRLTGDGTKRWDPVVVAHQFGGDRAGFDMSGPADEAGHAVGAFAVGILFRTEGSHGAVRPGVHVGPVVRAVNYDGIVGDPQVIEGLEDFANGLVVLDHPVDIFAVAMGVAAAMFRADVGAQMHARGV